MPGRRRAYILTETAVRDFKAARAWSLRKWGKAQTLQYFKRLHEAAEHCARNQAAVQKRGALTSEADLGVYPIGEHYLVYASIAETRIAIVALIRQTRDVPAILQADSFRIRRALQDALGKR